MKAFILFCLPLLLWALAPAAAAQKTDTGTAAVLAQLEKYDAAWNKKDAAAVGAILAPEYVYFDSRGGLANRQETLDFLGAPRYALTFVERSEIKAVRRGDTVVVSSRWKGKGTYNDEPIDDDQRCGQVFVRDGRRWLLLSENCVQIAGR